MISRFLKNKQNDTGSSQDNEKPDEKSFLRSLKKGLAKTSEILNTRIDDLILGKKDISHDLLEDLEEILITSDLGVKTTHKLIEQVQAKVKRGEAEKPELIKKYLKESISSLLAKNDQSLNPANETPFVIMVIGVNGTGKTTTIAKMAYHYKSLGKKSFACRR
jgi:fused signal recognition particle receptor